MKASSQSERILIIDDDESLADVVSDLLVDEGYAVTRYERAADLERGTDVGGFDLAIIELNIGEQGLKLFPRLRRLHALVEIVVTGHAASLPTAMQALQSGAHAYLPKPFMPEELLVIARRALAQVALKRERQALSERLALSESLYRSVVETVESCILGLDAAGSITFANRFAVHCLGGGQPLLGRPLAALLGEAGQRRLASAVQRAQGGATVRDQDLSHPLPGGARTVRWNFSPLHATNAHLARQAREVQLPIPTGTVLAVGQDITDRLALEQRTAANQALAAIGTLTTGLAHEIRNPLNAATLQLELMQRRAKRGGSPELAARLIEPANLVRTEIERLTKMLDEFLNLASPSAPVRVNALVSDLFEAVIASEAPAAARQGIVLRAQLAEPELRFSVDPEKLKAALLHLVRNSVDAIGHRGQGEIVLRGSRVDDGMELCVLDDGPGLHTTMQGRAAFEPFATTKEAGTGLGLALVQSAVAQHGGQVELTNRADGGAVARILIPQI